MYKLIMSGSVGVLQVSCNVSAYPDETDKEVLARAVENSKQMASRNYYRFVLWKNEKEHIANWSIEQEPTVKFLHEGPLEKR